MIQLKVHRSNLSISIHCNGRYANTGVIDDAQLHRQFGRYTPLHNIISWSLGIPSTIPHHRSKQYVLRAPPLSNASKFSDRSVTPVSVTVLSLSSNVNVPWVSQIPAIATPRLHRRFERVISDTQLSSGRRSSCRGKTEASSGSTIMRVYWSIRLVSLLGRE